MREGKGGLKTRARFRRQGRNRKPASRGTSLASDAGKRVRAARLSRGKAAEMFDTRRRDAGQGCELQNRGDFRSRDRV